MCWYVTIGVSPEGAPLVEELASRAGRVAVRRSTNPSMATIFPRRDIRLEVTSGGCSCDLYAPAVRPSAGGWEGQRERYREKGWSEAKIDRAIAARDRAKGASIGRTGGIGPERLFREIISQQVAHYRSVRMLAHTYSGPVDKETVASETRVQITLLAFLQTGFPPDTLVEVVAEPE